MDDTSSDWFFDGIQKQLSVFDFAEPFSISTSANRDKVLIRGGIIMARQSTRFLSVFILKQRHRIN